MTTAERERLIELINNPEPGSKIAAARDFGIDLTLLVENLERTPTERLQRMAAAHALHAEMRRAMRRLYE